MTNTSVLIKFIKFLTNKNIDYVILGDTDKLPCTITSDIDISLSLGNYKNSISIIQEFANQEKINIIQVLQHEQVAYYFALVWFNDDGKINFLHPDICTDYYRLGIAFISKKKLLNNSEESLSKDGELKGFIVPKSDMRFIYYFIKRIDKKDIQEDHFKLILKEWVSQRTSCLKCLNEYWSKTDVQVLIKAFDGNSLTIITDNIYSLSKGLKYKRKTSIYDWLFECYRKLSRFFNPTGLLIVFLGPDGCGKSTIIQSISHDLAPAFRQIHYQHLRPKLGCKKKEDISISDPHRQTKRNVITSIIKIFYFLFDYVFGYYFTIKPKLVRSTLVIFDRYYHDILVDPKRYRYGGPFCLAYLISRFIPKPDLVILLDAPAEILQSRKQEVPFTETVRQRQSYLELIKEMPNGVVVDASKPLQQVVQSVNKIIVKHMATRINKRFGH